MIIGTKCPIVRLRFPPIFEGGTCILINHSRQYKLRSKFRTTESTLVFRRGLSKYFCVDFISGHMNGP